MNVRIGTSGFSYKEWKGPFYPEKLAAKDMLRFYGGRFGTVEINNTFYRMPKPALLEGWAAEVPPAFAFALKAPQRITHFQRLQDVGDGALDYLFDTAAALGGRRGPFLFQLPPNFKQDLPRLVGFLARVRPGERIAVEFRHASWFEDAVFEALHAANAALCIADTGEETDAPLRATAYWGYLRLRRVAYEHADLAAWAERLREQPWGDAFVYFKHEDEATGPRLAARFGELVGS